MLENILDIARRFDFETPAILRRTALAHRYLGRLKEASAAMPNQDILVSTLPLQESEHSSAIENIVSTQDALYQARLNLEAAGENLKAVHRDADALMRGFQLINQGFQLNMDVVLKIQETLLPEMPGVRSAPGTVIMNSATGEIVHRPPEPRELGKLLEEWEEFLVDDSLCSLDPLTKMALIHHQFETIHPFYDGNGRTGRIINILYLVSQDLLDYPILYLSRYINRIRGAYYHLLQAARKEDAWEEWVIYMTNGVYLTAHNMLTVIYGIRDLLQETKEIIRTDYKKIYSHELLNNIFKHPYTKIQFLVDDLGVAQNTASRYLNTLVEANILEKRKLGRENYYVNTRLFALLSEIPEFDFGLLEGPKSE